MNRNEAKIPYEVGQAVPSVDWTLHADCQRHWQETGEMRLEKHGVKLWWEGCERKSKHLGNFLWAAPHWTCKQGSSCQTQLYLLAPSVLYPGKDIQLLFITWCSLSIFICCSWIAWEYKKVQEPQANHTKINLLGFIVPDATRFLDLIWYFSDEQCHLSFIPFSVLKNVNLPDFRLSDIFQWTFFSKSFFFFWNGNMTTYL